MTVAPGPVSGLKATPRGDGMLLSWTAPTEGIAGYRVSRWNPATSACEPLHTGLLPTTTESHVDQSAAPGSTYFYTFEALRADGSGGGGSGSGPAPSPLPGTS
ncbi:hypothetical protein ACFQ8S_00305 [Streptomyces virginiae]|uniref:hypothetical protein n=1 Tax=Streptomyces virginiae TaxID=1961 RepID=UPI0036CC8E6B